MDEIFIIKQQCKVVFNYVIFVNIGYLLFRTGEMDMKEFRKIIQQQRGSSREKIGSARKKERKEASGSL